MHNAQRTTYSTHNALTWYLGYHGLACTLEGAEYCYILSATTLLLLLLYVMFMYNTHAPHSSRSLLVGGLLVGLLVAVSQITGLPLSRSIFFIQSVRHFAHHFVRQFENVSLPVSPSLLSCLSICPCRLPWSTTLLIVQYLYPPYYSILYYTEIVRTLPPLLNLNFRPALPLLGLFCHVLGSYVSQFKPT